MNIIDLGSYNFSKMILLLLSAALFIAVSFVGTIVFLIKIPADFLIDQKNTFAFMQNGPLAFKIAWKFLKNLAGLLLLAVGIFMLVAPGPGILTIMLAAMLIDFPAKAKFQRSLIRQQAIFNRINRIRASFKKKPLIRPPDTN